MNNAFFYWATAASFFMVILGQLCFTAANYYLNIKHPSWIFWLWLYGALCLVFFRQFDWRQFGRADLFFFVGVLCLGLSFAYLGRGDAYEFIKVVALVWVGPFLVGRMLSSYVLPGAVAAVYAIGAITAALLFWQIILNPDLINDDRLILFRSLDWDGRGGDGTAAYIGMAIGISATLLFRELLLEANNQLQKSQFLLLGALIAIAEFLMVFFGSRGALLAFFFSCLMLTLLVRRRQYFCSRNWPIFLAVILVAVVAFQFVPEERRTLVAQVYDHEYYGLAGGVSEYHGLAGGVSEYHGLAGGVSGCDVTLRNISTRIVLISEAVRLFESVPFLGIGAGNFGIYYCGAQGDFLSPHNIILQLLVEVGVFGMLPWLMFSSYMVVRFLNPYRKKYGGDTYSPSVVFLIWMYFVMISVISGNIYTDYGIFILSGLLVASLKRVVADQRF